MGHFVWT